MTNDEKRVTEMAEEVCKRINPSSVSPLNSQKDYVTMTPEELLAFEQEVLKRAGLEVLALREAFVWKPISSAPLDNKKTLLIARFNDDGTMQGFDTNAIWESDCESWEMPERYYYWASDYGNVEEPTHWMYQPEFLVRVDGEALTNSEASAKRIKAGNAAEVLEEAATVVTETYSDYDGNSLPCFETVGECADKLKAMAEERRAIAKGEK